MSSTVLLLPLFFLKRVFFSFSQAAPVATLPSALFVSDIRSVQVGRTRFSRCCYLIIDLCSPLFEENWARHCRSHLNSAVELGCSDRNSLGCGAHRFVAIAQRFVHLSAHPQPMQQYRQLSGHRNYRSFFPIFPSTLCKLQSPSPQITVCSKGPQNVMRSLHQHGSQIPVSFFADVLEDHSDLAAAALVAAFLTELARWSGRAAGYAQEDDITLIALDFERIPFSR